MKLRVSAFNKKNKMVGLLITADGAESNECFEGAEKAKKIQVIFISGFISHQ